MCQYLCGIIAPLLDARFVARNGELLVVGLLGFGVATGLMLAFFPPKRYADWIVGRAQAVS